METPLSYLKSEKRRREEAADDGIETPLETINIRELMRSQGGKVGMDSRQQVLMEGALLNSAWRQQLATSQDNNWKDALELEMRNKEQHLAAARLSRSVAQKDVVEVERLLDAELSTVSQLESEKAALVKRLQLAEEEAREAKAALRSAEVEHKKQLEQAKFLALEAQHQMKVAQAECDHKCVDAALEARTERKRREADQAVLAATQAQLEQKVRELGEGDKALEQCQKDLLALKSSLATVVSPPPPLSSSSAILTSTTGLLAERVRQLEEALTRQKMATSTEQHATARGPTDGHPAGPVSSDGVRAAELLRTSSVALDAAQARLRIWDQALLGALASVAAMVPSLEPPSPSSSSSLTPDEVATMIRKLLDHANDLRGMVEERDAQLLELSAMHQAAEARARNVESRLWESSAALQSASIAETTAVCRLEAVERERDALRRALAPPSPLTSKGHPSPGTVSEHLQLAQQAAHAQELQELVTDLQFRLTAAQQEVASAKSSEARHKVESEAAEARARDAEAKSAQLEKEANSLALDVSALQEKLGRGEVNRSSVRVLHLKMNPQTLLQREVMDQALAESRAENEALKLRLDELAAAVERAQREGGARAAAAGVEGGGGGGGGGGGDVSSVHHALTVKDAQVAVLQHRLGELEKTMVRLKEVTRERIAAFREACYLLFGFRVDMTSEATLAKDAASAPTTFSLKPQHADDPGTVLVFRYTKSRGMELVPNSYSGKMCREVDTFISKFKSIPAFTANLTMESFQKQTAC